MLSKQSTALLAVLIVSAVHGSPQSAEDNQTVPLVVAAGTPLRVYLTKRLSKRMNEPVESKLLDPLFAFDREVVPAGSRVLGTVVRLKAISKMQRAAAILGGDFTPLHEAEVEYTTLVLPDGRCIPLHTVETAGLKSIAELKPPRKKTAAPKQNSGVLGTAKTQVQNKIDAARTSVADAVRAPDRKARLEDFLWAKLPYHPQRVRKGTRFDAELIEPLQFGTVTLKPDDVRLLGSQPISESTAQVRLITPLDSSSGKQGEPVTAIMSRPLFSSDHKLILPEGTRLSGAVTMVNRARWFHRGGHLRFSFQEIDLPDSMKIPNLLAEKKASTKTLATLQAAEADGKTPVKVDQEGGVKATEPKTRLLAPLIAAFIATKAADNDTNKATSTPGNNTGGRTLGGASGFGLLGAAAAKASPNVASALGFYGLAWSVYLNIIARGSEVEFHKNAALDVRFGGRTPIPSSKFTASARTP